jgi:hypothetical protein
MKTTITHPTATEIEFHDGSLSLEYTLRDASGNAVGPSVRASVGIADDYVARKLAETMGFDSGPMPVPESATARQLFPVLRRAHGITPEMIEAAISNPAVIPNADDRADALIEFKRAYIVERNNPLIALLAGVFGLTEAQIDAAFRAAALR